MKTSELIEHLSKLPQDAEVLLYVDGEIRTTELAPEFDEDNYEAAGNFIIVE